LSSLLPRASADVNGVDVRCIHAVDNRTLNPYAGRAFLT
jgi:hypothetical protein